MTMREVVKQIESQGHLVKFRIRTDGGILITSIDGMKFSGAKGNSFARGMIGVTLSEARAVQTAKNVQKYIKKKQLTEDLKKEIRKVQRKWRKNKIKAKGKVTTKKVRWNLENLGEKEARKKLRQMEKYAEGIAYSENVEWLAQRIESFSRKFPEHSQKFQNLADKVRNLTSTFKEDWIDPINQLLYELNVRAGQINPLETISKIERIIGI